VVKSVFPFTDADICVVDWQWHHEQARLTFQLAIYGLMQREAAETHTGSSFMRPAKPLT